MWEQRGFWCAAATPLLPAGATERQLKTQCHEMRLCAAVGYLPFACSNSMETAELAMAANSFASWLQSALGWAGICSKPDPVGSAPPAEPSRMHYL